MTVSSFVRGAIYAGATVAALASANAANAKVCSTTSGVLDITSGQPKRVVPEGEEFGVGSAVRGATIEVWAGGTGFRPNASNHSAGNRDQYPQTSRKFKGRARVLGCE